MNSYGLRAWVCVTLDNVFHWGGDHMTFYNQSTKIISQFICPIWTVGGNSNSWIFQGRFSYSAIICLLLLIQRFKREEKSVPQFWAKFEAKINTSQEDGLLSDPSLGSQGIAMSHVLQWLKKANPTIPHIFHEVQSRTITQPDIFSAYVNSHRHVTKHILGRWVKQTCVGW